MGSDLSIDSLEDSLSEFYLAPPLNLSHLDNREITWRDVPEIRSEIERRILDVYFSGNHVLACQMASLYSQLIHPQYEVQLVKSSKANIYDSGLPLDRYLKEVFDRRVIESKQTLYEAGLIKDPPPPLEPISSTNYPTLWAWQVYCLENGISLSSLKTHSGGFKEFWKEHKKEIIIAAVVIAVAATVAVVIVMTVGSGTNIAVAAGAGAVQAAIDDFASSDDSDPDVQNLQYDSKINEGIQNFAKGIGATDVNIANGAIPIIETSSISSEISSEVLTDLVADWNLNLTKNNYASQADHFFDGFQCPSPFGAIPLIGNQSQSTINYHCGIGNSAEEIAEGGACLYETLDKEFAVQPHLLHSPSAAKGLGFVALEQIEKGYAQGREILKQVYGLKENETLSVPKLILENSNIQKSIDYTVENLSKIAQNIIEQKNPNLKQVHVTFSNGGHIFNEALKQLPPEYQETIIIITTGTTAIVEKSLAHNVYNIIGDKDKGSLISNGGLSEVEKAQEDERVVLIEQKETQDWIGGHYFMQPDYQEAILNHLKKNVSGNYEIY